MMRPAVTLLLLLSTAVALKLRADSNDEEWKLKPVEKVVSMLKDMQVQLDNESKNDQELYDKLACWCGTGETEKAKAIGTAKQQISDLTAAIEEYTAKDQQLEAEIGTLKADIASGKKALAEATAVRAKELAEFDQDEKDMIESIGSLKGAVITLGKHNPGAALVQRETLMQVTKVLRRQLQSQPSLVTGAVSPHRRPLLLELLKRPDGMVREAFLQQPMDASGATSYNSRSGEIFGMLKQMKETFEQNKENAQTQEATAAKAFAELKVAKVSQLKAASDQQFEKEKALGDTRESNAQSKEDLSNTEDALEQDTNFLADLKNKCATTDTDWAARSKTRQEEITTVSQTIAILTEDEANDHLTKAGVFIQLRATAMREEATHAKVFTFLADAGKRLNSTRVAFLATRMRFDPFGKMRESIDNMTVALGKEKDDEISHKDECVDDLHTNDKESTEKHTDRHDLVLEISELDADAARLADEKNRLIQEIADTQLQMRSSAANREKEHKDNQETVADQRATQAILLKAVAKLGEFYERKAALLQRQEPGAPVAPMPAGFEPYKKAGGGGAMAMIQQIISDSKATEHDAIVSETDAQHAYEAFVQDSNRSIKTLQASIASTTEDLAQEQVAESLDQADKKAAEGMILKLGDMNAAIHGACDFTLDNFDERQNARNEEAVALQQAKAIFSGAGFGL